AVRKAGMFSPAFRARAIVRAIHTMLGRANFACAVIAAIAVSALPAPASATQSHSGMVVAESAQAANAGVEILRRGGNAIDAAAATALAVGVTNPASCGIGGGGFMLIYLARTHSFYALDYRERAPLGASATMYVRSGKVDEELARSGPLAVA